MRNPIRLAVVDDHEHAREAVREIIGGDARFELIAEGRTGKDALRIAAEEQPDVLLMDIRMPELNGLDATKQIKALSPDLKIVIMTVSDDVTDLFEAIKKGAQGYLVKSISPVAWGDYLEAVAADEAPVSKELALRLLAEFTSKGASASAQPQPPQQSQPAVSGLTDRELDVLRAVAQGMSNREVAQTLFISEHTVKNHLKNILQKLHLDNRVQLTRYAFEQGIVKGH